MMEASKLMGLHRTYRFFGALLIVAVACLLVPRFASYTNIVNLVRQTFLLTLISYGVALSMLIKGLDLSVGSVAALSSCLAATLITNGNVVLGILVGLLAGGLCGLVSGFVITTFKLPDFVMTFSMMYIARGVALTYTQGGAIYDYPRSFAWLGKSFVGPIPMPVIISAIVMFLLHVTLGRTVLGRFVYAVGANREVARYSGIQTDKLVIQIYTVAGILAGLAGLVYIARMNAAQAELGMLWPLTAIAVCVIGGITFTGGEGNILGLLLGALVMSVISNCINLLGIPSRFQDFFLGFMIIVFVTLDHYLKKRGG